MYFAATFTLYMVLENMQTCMYSIYIIHSVAHNQNHISITTVFPSNLIFLYKLSLAVMVGRCCKAFIYLFTVSYIIYFGATGEGQLSQLLLYAMPLHHSFLAMSVVGCIHAMGVST